VGKATRAAVVEEFEQTRRMLEQICGPLDEHRPNVCGSLERRREPLRVLHRQQISLLRNWRHFRQLGDEISAAGI
jgi:phosphoenolpyruvate carboxylase